MVRTWTMVLPFMVHMAITYSAGLVFPVVLLLNGQLGMLLK